MIDFFRKILAKKNTNPELFNGTFDNEGEREPNIQLLMDTIGTHKNVLTFLHNTKDENIAKQIISKGFSFVSHLEYTTDLVTIKDPLTIEYFNVCRRMYGSYTIIIQISKKVVKYYSKRLERNKHLFYEALTLHEPEVNEDNEEVITLAPFFIKGYIDNVNQTLHLNPNFDPSTIIPKFDDNVNSILE